MLSERSVQAFKIQLTSESDQLLGEQSNNILHIGSSDITTPNQDHIMRAIIQDTPLS